ERVPPARIRRYLVQLDTVGPLFEALDDEVFIEATVDETKPTLVARAQPSQPRIGQNVYDIRDRLPGKPLLQILDGGLKSERFGSKHDIREVNRALDNFLVAQSFLLNPLFTVGEPLVDIT